VAKPLPRATGVFGGVANGATEPPPMTKTHNYYYYYYFFLNHPRPAKGWLNHPLAKMGVDPHGGQGAAPFSFSFHFFKLYYFIIFI
jgi:hypothetical protein